MKLTELTNETEGASEGKWFEFTFSDGKTQQLRLASSASTEYQNFAANRWNAARRGRQTVPPPAMRRILCDGIIQYLLKDWKGDAITEDDGVTPLPFTEKNVRAVIEGRSLEAQALRDFIIEQTGNTLNYLKADGLNGTEEESASAADVIKSSPALASGVGQASTAPQGT